MIIFLKSKWNRKLGDVDSNIEVEFCSIIGMKKVEVKLELLGIRKLKCV